jgi:hypothetical protein
MWGWQLMMGGGGDPFGRDFSGIPRSRSNILKIIFSQIPLFFPEKPVTHLHFLENHTDTPVPPDRLFMLVQHEARAKKRSINGTSS